MNRIHINQIKTEIENIRNQIATKKLCKETVDNLQKRILFLKIKLSKRGSNDQNSKNSIPKFS